LVYTELGYYDRAAETFFNLLTIDEEDADVWYMLGFIFHASGYYDEAAACLEEAGRFDEGYVGEEY
jgi:tetratricopeptide (TPR) repeat protein